MKFAALCLVFLCGSCAALRVVNPGLSVDDQYDVGVKVGVLCSNGVKSGSGVAISAREVLTARHVITCPVGEPLGMVIVGQQLGEDVLDVVLDSDASSEVDAVRLVVAGTATPFKKWARRDPSGRKLQRGEVVCVYGMNMPDFPMAKCGRVAAVGENRAVVSTHIVPGNSGGPVFDGNGYLVGLAVAGQWDADEEFVAVVQLTGSFGELMDVSTWVDME